MRCRVCACSMIFVHDIILLFQSSPILRCRYFYCFICRHHMRCHYYASFLATRWFHHAIVACYFFIGFHVADGCLHYAFFFRERYHCRRSSSFAAYASLFFFDTPPQSRYFTLLLFTAFYAHAVIIRYAKTCHYATMLIIRVIFTIDHWLLHGT